MALCLYGLAVAVVAVAVLAQHAPAVTMLGRRVNGVSDAMRALNRGAPLLTGYAPGLGFFGFAGSDQGIYLYFPLLGQFFGQSDPEVLMKWFFLIAFALPVAVYPLVFAELFDSVALGILAPLLFCSRLPSSISPMCTGPTCGRLRSCFQC